MNKTALITGASSGIGFELAKVLASKGNNLVLVARNKSKLEELKVTLENDFPVSVCNIVKDLSKPNSAQDVFDEVKSKSITINYLINNAGFGEYGLFSEIDWTRERDMINLNISALVQLSKLYLNEMLPAGKGKIMNVASTAAFQPGPGMAVYFATKAFVLHFTEAINNEVRDSGVTVTALCPGATISGFKDAASMNESRLFNTRKLPSSKEVAEYGYKAMMKGKSVAIHGKLNYLLANSIRFAPRNLVVNLTRIIQGRVK